MVDHMPGFVEITCPDVRAFRPWQRADFDRAVAAVEEAGKRLDRGEMSKAACADVETAVGFRRNSLGIVADAELCELIKPEESFTWDWVHTMLQGGVLTSEVEALLEASSTTRVAVKNFLGDERWCFPTQTRDKSRNLHRIFDERRVAQEDSSKLKASCSELLGVYGLLRFFFELELVGKEGMTVFLSSFLLLCGAIDLLLAAKRRMASVSLLANELDTQLTAFLRTHVRAYGDRHVQPKHHWLLDVASQIRQHQMVLDAFIVERIHLRIKAVADNVKKTNAYESSCLKGTLAVQLSTLESQVATGGLLGKTAPMPGVVGARVADRMEVAGIEIRVDDVVVYGEDLGVVVACAVEGCEVFALVRALATVDAITATVGRYSERADVEVWPALSCVPAVAWRCEADGSMVVVRR
jgi:hypothetical protein